MRKLVPEVKARLTDICGFFGETAGSMAVWKEIVEVEKLARSTLCCSMLIRLLDKPSSDKVKLRRSTQAVLKECTAHQVGLPKYVWDRSQLAITMAL